MRAHVDFYAALRDALFIWPGSDADTDRYRLTVLAHAATDCAERLRGSGLRPEQVQVVLEWETRRVASEFDGLAVTHDRLRTAMVVDQIRLSVGEAYQPSP